MPLHPITPNMPAAGRKTSPPKPAARAQVRFGAESDKTPKSPHGLAGVAHALAPVIAALPFMVGGVAGTIAGQQQIIDRQDTYIASQDTRLKQLQAPTAKQQPAPRPLKRPGK